MRFFRFPSLLVLEVYLVLSLAVHGRPTPVIQGRQGGAVTAVVDVTVFETMTPSGSSPPASNTDSSTRSEITSTTSRTQATSTTTTGAPSIESLPITTLSTSASSTTTDASSKPTSLADEEVSATTDPTSTGTKEMTETGAVDTSTGTSSAKESASEVVSTVTATSIYSEAGALITSASIQVVTVDRPVGGIVPAPVATPVQVVTANPIANPAVNPVGNPIAPRPSTAVTGRPITGSTTSSSRMSRLGSSTTAAASSTTATAIALVPLTTNSEGDAAPATKTESSSQNKPPKLADMLVQGISSTCESTCAAFTDLVEECKGPNVMEDFPSANEADAQERCLCSQPDPVRECAECASGLKVLGLYGSFVNRCRVDGLLTVESTKSITVTDVAKATATTTTIDPSSSTTKPTVEKAESGSKKSGSQTFGPEEICNVDGQSISNREAYDQCVTDTRAMNLSIGPDGTIHQDQDQATNKSSSTFCQDAGSMSSACYTTICEGQFSSECFRKLEGGALSVHGVGKGMVTTVFVVVAAFALL